MVGESGIGKSECALDLVVRGHRLVADDTVEVRRRAASIIVGSCPELTRHHMEVRGLGVINLRDLFGVASTRTSKRVELVVQLERWDPHREYDRLGHRRGVLRAPRPARAAHSHAGCARPQPGDSRRGRRAQPAAAHARHQRRARPGGAARRAARRRHADPDDPDDDLDHGGGSDARRRAATPRVDRTPLGAHARTWTDPAARTFSSSPACPAPASRTRSARSRISATTASTTCRRR